jgi:hypothetical protein
VQKNGNGSAPQKLALLVMFALVLFCVGAVTPASASVTYNLTFSEECVQYCGSFTGTGTLTISPFPPMSGSGSSYYDVGGTGTDGTLSLNITLSNGIGVGSTTFTFNTASSGNSGLGSACAAQFNYPTPSFNSITCDLTSNSGGATLDITSNSSASLSAPGVSQGLALTSALAPAVTPEPSTLLLWGTGLLALGGIFRKKLGVVL